MLTRKLKDDSYDLLKKEMNDVQKHEMVTVIGNWNAIGGKREGENAIVKKPSTRGREK